MTHDAPREGEEESLFPQEDARGGAGERAAAEFLRKELGFRVVAQNWRNPEDEREEIDLVMLDQEILVFVEVKTRKWDAVVPGYFHVGSDKKKVLRRAARAYLKKLRVNPRTFRLDIVEVELRPGRFVIRHFSNIPLFGKFELA